MWLLPLLFLAAPDCWPTYTACERACNDQYEHCAMLDDLASFTMCMGGPSKLAMWCRFDQPPPPHAPVMSRPPMMEVVASTVTIECLNVLPTFCRPWDADGDGDVDLLDWGARVRR